MSLDPGYSFFEMRRLRDGRLGGSTHHDHGNAEVSGRLDFPISRGAAAVLGDNEFDSFAAYQRFFVDETKRTTRKDQAMRGQGVDLRGPFDRAHEIAMLRRAGEGAELLPALREEDIARLLAERARGVFHCLDFDPAIAVLRRPCRARERKQGNFRRVAGFGGMARHLRREGVRRVDHSLDMLGLAISVQARSTAKTADPHRQGRARRLLRAAGQRQDRVDIFPQRNSGGQRACFRRAAENEKAQTLAPQRLIP
jgi:hypothetical protein